MQLPQVCRISSSIGFPFDLLLYCQVEREKSAGKDWFNMPAPHITPELKNDLKVIKMRGALDPSRHYKANDSKETPRYFQVCLQ